MQEVESAYNNIDILFGTTGYALSLKPCMMVQLEHLTL